MSKRGIYLHLWLMLGGEKSTGGANPKSFSDLGLSSLCGGGGIYFDRSSLLCYKLSFVFVM